MRLPATAWATPRANPALATRKDQAIRQPHAFLAGGTAIRITAIIANTPAGTAAALSPESLKASARLDSSQVNTKNGDSQRSSLWDHSVHASRGLRSGFSRSG